MAGDWIKMRVDLGDDPAVVQIAARLDTTEDEVVGKLHRLWSWADKHTTDGTAPAITAKWVDRYVGSTGFADAMGEAGWISFSVAGVLFPSFDRHNGESAKRRGEAAIRQRLSRKNRDDGVTGLERTAIPRPFTRHVMERDAHTCVYCGRESTAAAEASRKAILSVDHITPITRGGSAAVENLACCCRACNGEKNDRTPEEWDLLPTFLQPGVFYKDGLLVTDQSQKSRDKAVTREEKRREDIDTVPKGTGGAAANGKRDKTPAERRKSELWRGMKEFLVDSGESKDLKAAGAVITKAIQRFDEATALAGIEATLHARPAAAIAYLEGACQQATGARQNKQEVLESGNLAAAERFALEPDHASR